MSDEWRFFPCTMGEDPAFIFLDVGIRDTIDKQAPPNLVRLCLTYKSPSPNGLPTEKEFEPVKAIEDKIELFSQQNNHWYVGRITVDGHRYFYIYTFESDEYWRNYASNLSSDTDYKLVSSFRDDPKHGGYWNELYPTADDWRVINDLSVLKALEERGDDGAASRKVDHWIYFDTEENAQPFITWATSNGFTFSPEESHTTEDSQYCVRLHHHGTLELSDITSHTIALGKKAEEFDGDYDGWEVPVVKSDN